MIERKQATIYYAPTKRRRYFSRNAAIHGETMAIIRSKYPTDEDGRAEEMDRFSVMYRRMRRLVGRYVMARDDAEGGK